MKTYSLQNNNKLILKIGKIEEEKGDALLCWIAINLHNGPDSFHAIHRKAGVQVKYSFLYLEPHVREGSCFTSIPGLTEFFVILHSVLPFTPALYNDSFFNIINTIIAYKEKNVCRDLYLTFPTVDKKNILKNLLLYISKLENFSVYFICDNQEDYDKSVNIFDKEFTISWWRKLFTPSH